MTITTTADLIELVNVGQRADQFSFVLLDSARSGIGTLDVDADNPPTLSNDSTRTSFRTLSGLTIMNPPTDIDPTRERVMPVVAFTDGTSFPLGVCMFGMDNRNVYSWGEKWVPELFDENFLLDQGLNRSWSIGPGASVLTAFTAMAIEVLEPLGIPTNYNVPDATVSQDSPLLFVAGSSRLVALNTLAASLGALPPYFANDGTHTLKLVPPVGGSVPTLFYDMGTRIFDDSTTIGSSLYQAPNRYIVVGSTDPNSGIPIRAVYDLPASAPQSAAQTGRVVTAPIDTKTDVQSFELAAVIAFADALNDHTSYGTASFAAACDPRHDTYDIVDLFGVTYLEKAWSLVCASGGEHQHTLARLWDQAVSVVASPPAVVVTTPPTAPTGL